MAGQPPASQTAPIDEFRILWTSQKKQKLKKWQDGFLRFHTHNKKMIVYDETRTPVCDMFLQRADKLNVGDELEFEHHLVTVEEFMRRTAQDLSAIISPRRQQRQLKLTHQQYPQYPERGMRLQVPAQDSPLSARQEMHSLALPHQVGGVGETEHVSLTEILQRSSGQKHSSCTGIRTPLRGASVALFRSGTTMSIPGSDFRRKETPTRSIPTMRPPVLAAQGFATPVPPVQLGEEILDMPPPPSCVQPTREVWAESGHGIVSRKHSTSLCDGTHFIEDTPKSSCRDDGISKVGRCLPWSFSTTTQAATSTPAGNNVTQPQIRSSVGFISSRLASSSPPRSLQIHHKTPFDPSSRSLHMELPTHGRTRSSSPQATVMENSKMNQYNEGSVVSHRHRAYIKPTFTTPRSLPVGVIGDSTDSFMDDTPTFSPEPSQMVRKGRKRASENLPTTTIKLATTKRKMLLCRNTLQEDSVNETRRLNEGLTGIPEVQSSRQRRSVNSMVMTRGTDTDLSLKDTTFVERRGLEMDETLSITAARKTSTEMTSGFAANEPGGLGGNEVGGDRDGQETSAINSSIECPVISSARAPGQKEKGKVKAKLKTEESALVIGNSSLAPGGCLDETASLGNHSMPPPPTPRRRERKKRQQIKNYQYEMTGGTVNSREFGPWSVEAFELFQWRPPNLVD